MVRNAKLVHAFTQTADGGNPAGVITDADGLSAQQMQDMAAELGYSESAFVTTSDTADYAVRFFSPEQEVDLCGHATIATFHALIEEGKIYFGNADTKKITQETGAGVLPVECHADGLVQMTQTVPQFHEPETDRHLICNLLHIRSAEIMQYPVQAVSTGSPKLMIPVTSLDVLYRVEPDMEGIARYCEQNGIKGFYPFTCETKEDSDFHARQFNPLGGIPEDPITGVAAGALGAYSLEHKLLDKRQFVIEQGYVMDKPGRMYGEVSDTVKVGGYACTVGEKTLDE